MTQARLVGARYELGELIGYGGMAEVHLGHDTRLNRQVAIKMLRPDLARDPAFLTRFRREAHSAAGLNHPSIVSVYDTGEDFAPDGTALPFIVMEYVEGRTLRDILRTEGRLPARRAMEITADICAALDFSHRNGIIHRDIKPANVMITPAGAVKVMDFGIARAVADTSATITQTANVIGTAQYLSPEQARGESVDARSDVYSTGCLLYELITGVPPFQGDSPVAVAYQHVRENPVMPSARNADVPRMLDSIVMKALAKNQLNRYQSAGDMRADLQRAMANQPVVAETVMTDAERTQFIARTPPPPPGLRRDYEQVDDHGSRRTGLIWAAVVVALLLVIGVAAYAIAFLGNNDTTVKKTAVPDVIGQRPATATNLFAAHKLKLSAGATTPGPCTNGEAGRAGTICTLSPAVGVQVDENSVVTYHLYSAKTVSVPPVEGKQLTDAEDALHTAGLGFTIHPVNSTDLANQVLKQNPVAFATVPPGTKVVLDVSTGMIPLPNVGGRTYPDARLVLNNANFANVQRGDAITTTDPTKDDRVVNESPTPGKTYKPDQKVTLDYYRYVAPPPTCISTVPTSPSSPAPGGSSSPAGSSSSPGGSSSPAGSSSSASSSASSVAGLPACTSSS